MIVFHTIITGLPSLRDILISHGSDKAQHHQYHQVYEPLFASLRHMPTSLLEIGVEDGHSMASWTEYFTHPDTKIVGLAYKNKLEEFIADDVRISIVYGNQNSLTVQQELARKGNYTVIIDDGSHVPSHQWNTFSALWPFVKPGGLYIIEDIETSYWSKEASIYGNRLASEHNIMGKFKEMIDTAVNSEFNTGVDNTDVEWISFHRNCITLHKHDLSHKSRQYRFKGHLRGEKLPT